MKDTPLVTVVWQSSKRCVDDPSSSGVDDERTRTRLVIFYVYTRCIRSSCDVQTSHGMLARSCADEQDAIYAFQPPGERLRLCTYHSPVSFPEITGKLAVMSFLAYLFRLGCFLRAIRRHTAPPKGPILRFFIWFIIFSFLFLFKFNPEICENSGMVTKTWFPSSQFSFPSNSGHETLFLQHNRLREYVKLASQEVTLVTLERCWLPLSESSDHHPQKLNRSARRCIWRYHF
jgi:hypothetical protein